MKTIVHLFLAERNETHASIDQIVLTLAGAQVEAGLDTVVWQIGGTAPEFIQKYKFSLEVFAMGENAFTLNTILEERLNDLPEGTIVHLHGGFVLLYYTISKRLVKSGKKIHIVLSPHGSYNEYVLSKQSLVKRIYYYLFERIVIKNASLIHLLGPTEINGFNFYMASDNKPIVCLPDGALIENQAKVLLREFNSATDPFVLTYSGPIDIAEKGLDILIESLAKFSKGVYSPVELWIIGEGEDLEKLNRICQAHGLLEKIKFFGAQPPDRRKELLQQSHVFVHPSRNDVVAVNLMEAAAMGLPLIVSEETNLGSFVRQYEAGWCLSRNNVENLTQAFHEAYVIYTTDTDAYFRIKRNSAKMIREALSWNTLAKKWKEVYARFL